MSTFSLVFLLKSKRKNNTMKKIYYVFLGVLFSIHSVFAQEKMNQNETQAWIGYMTSGKINDHFSLWNDVHYASENFVLFRHGITYKLGKNVSATGGYAWGYLSGAGSKQLRINEQRPWGQIVFNMPMGSDWKFQQRIRYDARFKEKVLNGEIQEGHYGFNHRLRYMVNVRKTIDGKPFDENSTFLSLNNEVLVNFGKEITGNNLDQFRASLFIGKNFKNATVQLGYMYRYVPQKTPNTYKNYHGITLWINQNYKFKKDPEPQEVQNINP